MPRPRVYADGAARARAWRERNRSRPCPNCESMQLRIDAANEYLSRARRVSHDLEQALEFNNTTIGLTGAINRAVAALKKERSG